jgi:hypothetical protein
MVLSARSSKQQSNSHRRTVFSVRFVPRFYKQDISRIVGQSPAGENVSMETEDIVGIRHQATTVEITVD